MKKQVVSEQRVCDVEGCEKWCYDGCLSCGTDHCFDHKKILGIVYNHSVYHGGHADGYYCHECDKKLRGYDDDPLHIAYWQMRRLKEEYKYFLDDFKAREENLSSQIEIMYEERTA